jgi:hypothetical protein
MPPPPTYHNSYLHNSRYLQQQQSKNRKHCVCVCNKTSMRACVINFNSTQIRMMRHKTLNRLTAMVAYLRPLFFELRTSLISFRFFVRCQRLIARNVADGFLLFSLADMF